MPFSTHDWTLNVMANPFQEAWADVKTPGGRQGFSGQEDTRRTYVVGTIEVQRTGPSPFNPGPAFFSNEVATSDIIPSFDLSVTTDRRQVAMLQCNDAQEGIVWQRYFYGLTGQEPELDLTRATNARAVSVWSAEFVEGPSTARDPNTRIAICGETWDQRLLNSQDPAGWPAAAFGFTGPSGFIAVYNGNGVLQWTHHFFAGTDAAAHCAITDVSIRVECENGECAGDEIVTYCGIMTHGDPGLGSELSPLRPFAAPAGFANGATTRQPGWDAFVGRLRRSNGVTTREFHSIVSGSGQDGLFGLAEITADRFVVVGSTSVETLDPVLGEFPLIPVAPAAPYTVGAVLVFSAHEIASGGNLVLDSTLPLGGHGQPTSHNTVARDVCVGWDVEFGQSLNHVIYVVGSTDDPDFGQHAGQIPFLTSPPPALATLQGPTDGFLAAIREFPSDPPAAPIGTGLLLPQAFVFWGGPGHDGLTGVNCWNEFSDHVSVTGWHAEGSVFADIGVSTLFLNTAFGFHGPAASSPPTSTAPLNNTQQLLMIRDETIGGTSDDRPTRMGFQNATNSFAQFGLDRPEGGGVAVRNDGRINTVGSTSPSSGGYPFPNGRGPDSGTDAVRSVLDMVPPGSVAGVGVGRTDGTGFQGAGFVFPTGSFSGGTTPLCGLRPFGRRVGDVLPILTHMLIDYEGASPLTNGNDSAILVSRPPTVGSLSGGVLSVTLTPPSAQIWPTGVEVWLDPGAPSTLMVTSWEPNRPFRIVLPPLLGSFTMTVQYLHLWDPSGAPQALGAGCSSTWAASQAMFFSW